MRRDGNANTDPRVILKALAIRRERYAALEGRAQHNPDHGPLFLPGRCRSYDQRRCATASENLVAPACPVFGFLVGPGYPSAGPSGRSQGKETAQQDEHQGLKKPTRPGRRVARSKTRTMGSLRRLEP